MTDSAPFPVRPFDPLDDPHTSDEWVRGTDDYDDDAEDLAGDDAGRADALGDAPDALESYLHNPGSEDPTQEDIAAEDASRLGPAGDS
jgi:hypothetical protein